MKKFYGILAGLLILMIIGYFNTSQKIADLEEQVLMSGTERAGASFRPFTGGLIGDATGTLDHVTGVVNGDVGMVALKADATYGNSVFFYILNEAGVAGDNLPLSVLSGDAEEDWELAKGIFSGIWSYGDIHGTIEPINDDNSLDAMQCRGGIDKLTGTETTTLPAATAGMNVGIYSTDATVKTIAPNGNDHIWLYGVDNGATNSINSPGAIGDFIILWCYVANNWVTLGGSGVWINTP